MEVGNEGGRLVALGAARASVEGNPLGVALGEHGPHGRHGPHVRALRVLDGEKVAHGVLGDAQRGDEVVEDVGLLYAEQVDTGETWQAFREGLGPEGLWLLEASSLELAWEWALSVSRTSATVGLVFEEGDPPFGHKRVQQLLDFTLRGR